MAAEIPPRGSSLLLTCLRSHRRRNKENSPLSLDDCEGGDDDDAHNDADAVDLWEGGGQWFRMQSGSTDLHCNPSR